MKKNIFSILVLLLLSCQDDINDKKFRNSNYAFFKTNEKSGEWREIVNNSNTIYKKGDVVYFFFDNGQKYGKLKIIKNYPNREEYFYNNDTIVEKIIYKNDKFYKKIKKNGFHLEYYSNKGQILAEGNIKNNVEDGLWIDYYESGSLKSKNNYTNGLKYGKTLEYYENGKIKSVGQFWKGKKIDTLILYFESGLIKQKEIYNVDTINKVCIGIASRFYENGKIEKIIPIINWKREGICKIFYENGHLKYVSEYKNDKLNGIAKGYYENGIINYYGTTIDSLKDGKFNYFDEKGKLIITENYRKGKLIK